MHARWQTSRHWLLAFYFLLLVSAAVPMPVQHSAGTVIVHDQTVEEWAHVIDNDDYNRDQENQEPIPEFTVDVRQFANLLSTHLMFDHLENAFYLVAKKISRHFCDVIQVDARIRNNAQWSESAAVDVYVLKDQLKAAVESFIEDRLPIVWNDHASALDKRSLQAYIEHVVLQLCSPYPSQENYKDSDILAETAGDAFTEKTATVSSVCLEKRSRQFLASVDRYVGNHVRRIIAEVVSNELPALFETAQMQVKDILAHFNTYVLNPSDSHLELVLTSQYFGPGSTMDYTWVNSPHEMDEILDTLTHRETPTDEGLQKNDSSQPNSRRLVLAVHHFAALARAT